MAPEVMDAPDDDDAYDAEESVSSESSDTPAPPVPRWRETRLPTTRFRSGWSRSGMLTGSKRMEGSARFGRSKSEPRGLAAVRSLETYG